VTQPIEAAARRVLTHQEPSMTGTTLPDAMLDEMHRTIQARMNQLHQDLDAIGARYLTIPLLARELAAALAAAPPPATAPAGEPPA
jgi:hypothetical protein